MSQSALPLDDNAPWYKHLTSYHWFVFIVASLAWLFDCLDQQLFLLARNSAMKALLPEGSDAIKYGGYATSIFVAGWATGGLIFGSVGDRIGRAKTLTLTVLIYSVCTGLSAFSKGWVDFATYRFMTGLGVGGVFGLAVALVADTLPDRSRTGALGTLQALSAVGNVTAGLVSMYMGSLESSKAIEPGTAWKYMFLVGALPAFLCVFIQIRLKEPEKWVRAREAGKAAGVKFGSYSALLGDVRWRKNALLGMLLCVAGVIGLWGIGFFSPELVGDVIQRSLEAKGVAADKIVGEKTFWIGVNSIVQNIGAFFGMLLFTKFAQSLGRKKAFAWAYVAALVSTVGYFQLFNGRGDIWMSAIMGGCQLALFAGFAIYLPELFPTSLRSTGTSFCYNVGRFVAASGPFTLGSLQAALKAGATTPEAKLEAFRNACSYMSVIFVIGLIALMFMPETKGRPMPED
ncbi:Predicted arabinose efflux permease, MFS family [Prosthecobacter debontii]|uniref:Predicted arabinose efflux permease, MFS family n=1 Tax=Prosthecobacter debontii TaxID=48467 RepID=A0A1T4WX39_9BACT|nr:MFS transporter [Prosthecobacter debontii]SKA81920.1 Predicted arabinose efflux permease, MFS family [Prosthecobacter debontii]